MTPRERAEALGMRQFEFFGSDGWALPDGRTWIIRPNPGRWLVACLGRDWLRCPTEDEALAHALLLREVVLS